ncbi:MAG: hypothetical protein Q9168_007609, partial [Polycauliona sp. 1 TL-2023]
MSLSTLPNHCDPTSPFLASISTTFHTCIPTPLALLSISLGILSLISWLFAQLPQVIKNYKLKSASGLSIYFLAEWLLGDLANLLGALLTRQATWQVVVAAYYVIVDVCLVSQHFWYSHYKPWQKNRLAVVHLDYNDRGDDAATQPLMGMTLSPDAARSDSSRPKPKTVQSTPAEQATSPTEPKAINKTLFRSLNYSWSPKEKTTPSSSYRSIRRTHTTPSPGISPNTLLLISFLFALLSKASPIHPSPLHISSASSESSSLETAGRILSWTSTALYMGSRLPQILKNYRRRSTAGLSPILFIAAFFGNLFYSSSLLANPLAWHNAPP